MTKLSRSKIELSIDCPKCFWLDVKHGVKRPPPMPYTINNAIDYLLKQEFDEHRTNGTPHPVMEKNGIDAVPFQHPDIDKWRHNFTGIQSHHEPTDFLVFGAVDDIWKNSLGELIVVDYKATGANQHRIYDSYKRQMEIYQWLLKQNNFKVSPVGYFLFAKVDKSQGFGMGKAFLPFELLTEACEGDTSWIDGALFSARKILNSNEPPEHNQDCAYCHYRTAANK